MGGFVKQQRRGARLDDSAPIHHRDLVGEMAYQAKTINRLVHAVGTYDGTVPIDFRQSEQTTALEINADGDWAAESCRSSR